MIVFNGSKILEAGISNTKPILSLGKITFSSSDPEWTSRLDHAILTFKITCVDRDENMLKSFEHPLVLGQFITPYTQGPELEIDMRIEFMEDDDFHSDSSCAHWTYSMELSNLEFQGEERLNIDLRIMDKKHVQNRVRDWKERINRLYEDVKLWLVEDPEITIAEGREVFMHEGLMKTYNVPMEPLETLDVYRGSQLLFSFKPKGLWIMGANGRIDILSRSFGAIMLVDQSAQFEESAWNIVLKPENIRRDWSKQELLNIIDRTQS